MTIPTLSLADQKFWESIRILTDEDLYAVLGAEPEYYQPSSTPDFLLIGQGFKKTKAIISKGKENFQRILEVSRNEICKYWASLKSDENLLTQASAVAVVYEIIKPLVGIDTILIIPTAELICRLCSYNLDILCSKSI